MERYSRKAIIALLYRNEPGIRLLTEEQLFLQLQRAVEDAYARHRVKCLGIHLAVGTECEPALRNVECRSPIIFEPIVGIFYLLL